MAVKSEVGLIDEVVRLRAELRRREREAADKELQLQRYAADLREVFKQERARAQELKRSYMATVRALSNAVEARDAYTGKHAERVAAYGLEVARKFPSELVLTPELRENILEFYSNLNAPIATKKKKDKWQATLKNLDQLKAAQVPPTQVATQTAAR